MPPSDSTAGRACRDPKTVADEDWLALTPAQLGLFFAHQLDPGNPAYTTAEVVELSGAVDAAVLAQAIADGYAEFEQLRVEFSVGPDGPRQQVRPIAPVELLVQEAADRDAASALIDAELGRPLDPSAGEVTRTGLIRLADGSSWWWHAAHHVVLDGYGAQQLLRRIAALHDGAEPVEPVPLADLVAEQHRAADSEAFWDARLAAMTDPASLAGGVASPRPRAIRRALDLGAEEQAALVRGARRLRVTWADLVTAAVGSYVGRLLGTPSGRIGLPLMNRSLPGVGQLLAARTVCTAMNVLPASVPASGTIADALAATRAEQAALRLHPFERQEWLTRRLDRRGGPELFGTQVNVLPFDLELTLGGVPGTVRNLTAGPVEDLTFTLRGVPGRGRRVRLELDAHPELYDEAALDRHLARLRHWLGVWASVEPDDDVARLPVLPADEYALVTAGFNATGHDRESATLGQRFVTQAARTPQASALVFEDESRSYAELLERARRIAGGLTRAGVRAGDVVGVRLPRGFGLYEAIHAIALLGAVYCPVDPELPSARVEAMLADAGIALVVDDPDALAGGDLYLGEVPGEVDAPAYLLFTSGSTGRPKGVVIGHRAIDNRLAWMQHHLRLAPGERVLHKTPISFDVSIWELYWPLQVGGCVVIAPPGVHRDPLALAELIVAERVSVLHFVPSMLRAFLGDRTARERVAEAGVRHVVASGEALTPDLVAGSLKWFGVGPTNLYGPTEAAVDVTVWDCTAADAADGHSVPIGRPIRNTTCFVLDAGGQPVGVGVTGELWLGGVQLADGYVGRPELTAERFVDTEWGRLYRTGDLAAWRPDGALRYLGRTDDQVKIRGQRIELGEVEAALSAGRACRASAGRATEVAVGVIDGALVVWLVASRETADEVREELRAAAAEALPPSLVPTRWIAVDAIPLTASGKTDRRALTELASRQPTARAAAGEAPRDLLQQRVAAVIADVLGLDSVAADADFFALGGDSLSVLRLLGRLADDLGADIGLAEAFGRPTASGLADLIAGEGRDRPDDFAEVLTLRTGGDRPPLFLLPPAGGLGWCYTGLLTDLPSDLGVHTIQAPGTGTGAPEPVADLTALAGRQLAAIRTVVGDGPFHVAGWSLGGMAAHAVAALARGDGQQVGSVTLLDAYPAEQWHHLAEPTEAEALVGILRLAGLDAPSEVTVLTRDRVAEMLRASGSALAALPSVLLDGCIASVIEASRVVRTPPPARLAGDLTVVVAGAPRPETHLDAEGWRAHTVGAVRIVELPATHAELVRRPVSSRVAALLTEAIEAV
ncbi:MAG: amino acid adenylation domain-containing protein [Micropruina sp.]|uniref:amino acid adenylation domain-containing protein n=1 Tax=Micropruina sp. TaxID=2737536 RepID=UPI0039E3B7D7